MPESPTPQGEKGRKSRPFGSFLLFLVVLVVVLIAFGGDSLGRSKELSQDQFEWLLYTGRIAKLELRGTNKIQGTLVDDSRYWVSFADVADHEALYKELNAVHAYERISASELLRAVEGGWYAPTEARHLTSYVSELPSALPASEEAEVRALPSSRQEDRLYVGVTARSRADYAPGEDRGENPYLLPDSPGRMWLEVTQVHDFGALEHELAKNGARVEYRSFDLRENSGTTHGKATPGMLDTLVWLGPWLLIFGVFLLFMRQMRQQGSGAGVMSFGRSRAQLYTKENRTNVTFDDVAGAEEAKEEVREVVEFLKNPGRFTRIGGRIPRGVLLVGPPGCGKTLLAKAIAGEAEVPFFSISGSDFVEMFVGVGASRVRDLFKQARENSPCIIFLDEIDAVGRRRGSGLGGGHDEREQTLNAILVEMDGFGTDEGIIVVAATNRPDVLDPALLRPGRFDREVVIDLPDLEGRVAILKVHLKKVKTSGDVVVDTLARSTPGYSGADLAAIFNEAAIMAVLDRKDAIEMRHLEEAAATRCATGARRSRARSRRRIAASPPITRRDTRSSPPSSMASTCPTR